MIFLITAMDGMARIDPVAGLLLFLFLTFSLIVGVIAFEGGGLGQSASGKTDKNNFLKKDSTSKA